MDRLKSSSPDKGLALTGRVEGRERFFVLQGGTNSIGRGRSNDVVLPSSGVSDRHAVIDVGSDEIEVRDLASKNGTYLGGERVASGHVETGKAIQFGPVTMRIENVEIEDTWLSVTASKSLSTATRPLSQTSTFAWVDETTRTLSQHWLRLLDEVTVELSSGATGAVGRAVGAVCRGLGAGGGALLEQPAEGSPIVVASFGDLGRELPLQAIAELKAPQEGAREARLSMVADEQGSWTLIGGTSAPILVLAGELARGDIAEPLLRIVHRVLTQAVGKPAERARKGRDPLQTLQFPEEFLPGESPTIRAVYREIGSIADSTLPLLLVGETGVGKECMAQTLHLSSRRSDGPFLPINCAAIPADLLEAELFGIVKGVATGVVGRPGRFSLAEGGTVFLDEIGDMSAALQAKLLRALEENAVQPVGGAPEKINVRLVAATNTDLGRKVETGEFRRDLYYRLAGLVVTIPPLRQRQEDIAPLVEFFFHQIRGESGREITGLTYGAVLRLGERRWPGNVRELRHAIRRLAFLCPEGRAIDSGMVNQLESSPLASPSADGGRSTTDFTAWESLDLVDACRGLIREAMRRSGGNQTAAAALLGITRSSLRRRLAKLFPETGKGPSD